MRVVKCENNHYFDLEKGNYCPRCGSYEYELVGVDYSKADKKGKKKKEKPNRAEKKLKKAEEKLKKAEEKLKKTEGKNGKKGPEPKEENPAGEKKTAGKKAYITDEKNYAANERNYTAGKNTGAAGGSGSTSAVVKDTPTVDADLSDEKTVYFEDVETQYAEAPEYVEPVEPVVGWLVCMEGMDKGAHFILKAGTNNLGRSVNMDVSIRNDVHISRDRHSILTYDEGGREFFIAPGIGQGITYVNDKPVLSAQKLNEGDCIRMGKTKLIFIPLCSVEFGWR